ncbi:Low-density lipoprotein receptor domain class A [Ancylostoma duodenale]|uniref:Low-density lipoprotein receptor domain class A n=1 Tax=Ancylostoma duodenale TaxID=51022 RepID=A0A0C2H4G4_9BILA|nr:Low-density lipoprotein receptor domain class A [Ancylostoma duodenale]
MTSTSAPAPDTGRPSGAYEINFCDKCSIGQTFVLRCPSESQAFDSSITNCNFRNAIKVCPEFDPVLHCASCSRYEFACVKTGRCIPAEKRCDGVPDDCNDGSNFDELGCNRDPMCIGKFMCHLSQQGPPCIEWADHCNGVRNCAMGEDELNCRHLDAKLISCENQQQAIPRQNWCDGTPHCNDRSDEKYCY